MWNEATFPDSYTRTWRTLFECYLQLKGWSKMSEDDKIRLLSNKHRLLPEQQERLRQLNLRDRLQNNEKRKRERSSDDVAVIAPKKKNKQCIPDGAEVIDLTGDEVLDISTEEAVALLNECLPGVDDDDDSVNKFLCQEFALAVVF